MALIDCPECGRQVSEQADACPSCGRRLTDRLTKLESEIELTRIDFEWERARQQYLARTLLFGPTVPSTRMAVGGIVIDCLLIVFFAIVTVVALPEEARFLLLPIMGVGLVFRLGIGINVHMKARSYQRAEAEYLRRRDAVRAIHKTQDQD